MVYANANVSAVQRVERFLVNEDNNAVDVFTISTKHHSINIKLQTETCISQVIDSLYLFFASFCNSSNFLWVLVELMHLNYT